MKLKQFEEIRVNERLLNQQMEDTIYEERKLRSFQEEAEDFSYQTNQIFDSMLGQFKGNQFTWYLEEQQETMRYRYNLIQDALEEELQLHKEQQQAIEDKQSDLAFDRLRLQTQENDLEVQQ
ncbi:DUF3958 family protein [Enterococcus sp. BWR-S5]|uniref:DUF3958 family protein n=1 Tax=Enterococcus sp. BWR-S5 TaxID=2787714 RepID=UPI00192273E5|nr:DUF3958 family protein [Enterococcus sp. BWR-S5]MBL1227064.1 DUF3958 family protein [Enterococcus sp. BWR-S5]